MGFPPKKRGGGRVLTPRRPPGSAPGMHCTSLLFKVIVENDHLLIVSDFDVATLSTIRVVLTFSPAGTAVSFAALTQNGNMTDLGIGFIHLPSQLWMVVTGNAAGTGEKSSVKMVYKSGPTGRLSSKL